MVIYYVPIPQITAGGVQVMLEHVAILNASGVEAAFVSERDESIDWFPHSVRQISWKALRSLSSYTIVVPEIAPTALDRFRPATQRVLFAQNWRMMRTSMDSRGLRDYVQLGYDRVITCGAAMRDEAVATGLTGNLAVEVVTNAFAYFGFKEFQPDPSVRVVDRVLMLPRRNPRHGEAVAEVLAKAHSRADVVFAEGLSQPDLAAIMRSSDIYVHLGDSEGLPRPPMEAMACGCAVAGYHGRGGRDFMIHGQTALIAENGNVTSLIDAVLRLVEDTQLRDELRRRGRAHILRQHSVARMTKELLDVFADYS